MALSVLINGVEYACNLFRDTLSIRESLQANGSQMSGQIQLSGALEVPVGGSLIQVYRDGVLEFAGRIRNCTRDFLNFAMQYQIDCSDFTPDFDATFITDTFVEPTFGDQVRVIVGHVGRGFTSNNVETGPDTGEVLEVELEQPSSVINKLAESIEHQWYIDYERDVHFFFVRNRPAPVDSIDFETDLVNAFDLMVTEDVSQIKNVIYLTGAQVESSTRDSISWKADGDTRFFPLNYQPVSEKPDKIAVTVNGAYQTLKLDTVDGQAGDGASDPGSVYVCVANWGIRFADNSAPAEDAEIDVSYKYAVDTTVKVEEPRSIAMMRDRENQAGAPSDGRHEFKLEIPDLGLQPSEEPIVEYGNLILARYAFPIMSITFGSHTQGWQRGQFFRAISARHGLDHEVYITSVSKRILQSSDGVLRFAYEIEASSSPFPP